MDPLSITNSELEIMKELWEHAPQTSPELVEKLRQRCNWEENTIKTLLMRLVKKGVVMQDGPKRFYTYTPAVSKEHYQQDASERFVSQVFDCRPANLLNFFVKTGQLSPDDIAELKQLLEESEEHE